tara:strand:- start:5338 stop:5736 length:399 start_codon:yes stop_codon:yes gene_type:complete
MMNSQSILLNDILVRHWILFDYDIKDAYQKESVHYLFKVKDSIHYKSLISGDYSDYIKLIQTTNQQEHSLDSFLVLKENFNVDFLSDESNKIHLQLHPFLKKYVVTDGVHRLSILLYNGITELNPDWFIVQQ